MSIEAAHGTVQRHYCKYLKGEVNNLQTLQQPFLHGPATLRKRGELDNIPELMAFADKLEKATIDTIENGTMTKDLALITTMKDVTVANSEEFIKAIRKTLEAAL